MPRLLRPYIPVPVRCLVVLRQIGEMWPDRLIAEARPLPGGLGALLDHKLGVLAATLRCQVTDLQLDHDPPLGARDKVFNRAGEHVEYKPRANDPDHLRYRDQHKIKTNVRGDHGQHPDRVLIKRQRRRERAEMETKTSQKRQRKARPKPKRTWQARPLKSASRWPPRGSQKFKGRQQ